MVVEANVSLRQRRTKLDSLLTYDGPLADSEQEDFVALMESEAVSSKIRNTPSSQFCAIFLFEASLFLRRALAILERQIGKEPGS